MHDLMLIHKCQHGDREAFAALYDRYHQRVFRTALHLVREPALAEDITQEVFIGVFQEIDRLRTPAAFRTWLYRLVVSKTARSLRADGGERRPLSLDLMQEQQRAAGTDPGRSESGPEDAAALREALTSLPEDLRLTVLLHYYVGLKVAEVAEVLQIPPGTVKSRLHSARIRLGEALNSHDTSCEAVWKGARA